MKHFNILILFLLFCWLQSYAQNWEKVTNIPTPYNNGYYLDLWVLPEDNNYVWACGFDGFIIRSTNNGTTWQGSTLPSPAYHIESIQFLNKQIGYTSGVEGIFKSTDGGATWFDITPSSSEDYWGNYFLNENYGVLLGGGCDGLQRFYKTTNGGVSWSLYVQTVPNTGLTDPILYPSGLGYAVSSGRIWKTLDSGSTWQLFAYCGSEIWQEEISIMGNSIVVPTSGIMCEGQGSAGGMRFSTDMGTTWREFQAGYPMFGAVLVSQTEAWACGYDRNVYYTSDAGNTWQLRNCGIEDVNLDDITFTSPKDGWVVGQGVYRLKPAKITADRDTINFGKICSDEIKLDSFQVQNQSLIPANLTVQKTLDFDNAFSIIKPAYQSQIASCSNSMVVIQFSPTKQGKFLAKLLIDAQSSDGSTHYSKEIILIGETIKSSIKPEKDTIVLNPASCGNIFTTDLIWYADSLAESLSGYNSLTPANKHILLKTELPLIISPSGTTTQFQIQLLDTGWSFAAFKFKYSPCNKDTTITIKAYGVSPIINSIDSLYYNILCSGEIIDTIPIWNTGNAPLVISKISSTLHNGDFQILGWTSKKQLPISIHINSSDSLIIKYSYDKIGTDIFYITFDNNDKTLSRGDKQSYSIKLVCTVESEDIFIKNQIIDFGRVCLTTKIDTLIPIKNIGNLSANLNILKNCSQPFNLQIPQLNLNPDTSENIELMFSPTKRGEFFDTINIKTGDCKEIIIYLKGTGVEGLLNSDPSSISDILMVNQPKNYSLKISNTGNIPLDIIEYSFTPALTGFAADLQPQLSQTIDSNQSITFNLQIIANQISTYKGTLCFEAKGLCPTSLCIPIDLTSLARSITVDNTIDFPTLYCSGEQYDTLWIRNYSIAPDTVTQISISGDACFNIFQSPNLPAIINSNDSAAVIIHFLPRIEGNFFAILHIETIQPFGQTFDIPVKSSFYRTIISSNTAKLDFGIKEKCDDPIIKQFTIYNTGMADEFLYAVDKQFGDYFSIDKFDNLVIKGMDSLIINITFYPAIAQKEASYSGKIIWATTRCPDTLELEFAAQIIEPHLSYSKFNIDYLNVWKDDIKYDTIIVMNNSAVSRNLQIIKSPDNSDFQIFALSNNSVINFPILIEPQSILALIVSFKANAVGEFYDNFMIEESSVCKDTIAFHLQANVPLEQYYSKVFIEKYQAHWGDTITFYIELSDDLPRVRAQYISTTIEFDTYLFYPIEVSVRGENLISYNPIKYEYSYGKLDAAIDSSKAYTLLNSKGKLVAIKGIAMYSSPTITPLKISDFQVNSSKELYLTKEDGNLQVLDICIPIGNQRIIIDNTIPYIELVSQVVDDGVLALNCYNLSEGIQMYIYNTYGEKVKYLTLPKGTNLVSVDIKDLVSGVYFISFSNSELGNFKFIIIK
ncbi:MAG TPA: YCF48-related protein [Candidatus Kapabacteria bacterium]|nr:YCF48-related protein [Candidatus Kapabacteria bacterium]